MRNPNSSFMDEDALSTVNDDELKVVFRNPELFDLFFHGIYDNWYQVPILCDQAAKQCNALGRQSGKTQIVSQREIYNTFALENFEVLIVAPSERQSRELSNRSGFLISRNPILNKHVNKVIKSETIIDNHSKIVNLPVGFNADKIRGYTIGELVYEEAAFIPEAVYDTCGPFLASSDGTQLRQGTPFGKVNELYYAWRRPYRKMTIPEDRWSEYDILKKDQITLTFDNINKDDGYSVHHYPSTCGLNIAKEVKIITKEEWALLYTENSRKYRGWKVIKTDHGKYIGQPFYSQDELKTINDRIDQYITLPLYVGKPQISIRILKDAQQKWRIYQREYLALFLDEEGTAFPSDWIDRVINNSISMHQDIVRGPTYYGGIDVATGVEEDYTVIIIIAYTPPRVKVVYWYADNKRRPKQIATLVKALQIQYGVSRWYVDKNSCGEGFVDDLRELELEVDGVGFSINSKHELIVNLERLFDGQLVELPNLKELTDQLKELQKELSQNNQIKYHHPKERGKHDDYVWAFALACSGAKGEPEGKMNYYRMPAMYH